MIKRILAAALCASLTAFSWIYAVNTDVCAADGIALNSKNFPDEMFRDEVSWLADSDQNGTLSSAEIKAVTNMDFFGNYFDGQAYVIANCKGLEYFTELKDLNLYRNALQSLDVSKNTKLEMLDCSSNSISSLDISKNPNLKILCCFNTIITQIDISNNKYLLKAYNSPTSTVVNDTYTTYEYSNGNEKYYFAVNNSVKVITEKGSSGDEIPIDDSHFPDGYFREFVKFVYDKNSNGSLSNSEIKAVKEFDCRSFHNVDTFETITSVKGIEYFTEVTYLDCSECDIGSLDLSKNVKLTYLNCSANYNLKKLNISKNTKLKTLICGDTMLTQLDVSKNTELTELDIANTQLGDVDLSKNTKLINIMATRSGLTSLNISKCTKLETLMCDFDPGLAKLDISNCPNLVKAYKEHTNNVQKDTYGISYEYSKSGKNYMLMVSPETKITAEKKVPEKTKPVTTTKKPAVTTSKSVTTTKKPTDTTTAKSTTTQTETVTTKEITTTSRSEVSSGAEVITAETTAPTVDSSSAYESSIAESSEKSGFNVLYIVIPAAVVVIGSAIGAAIYIKKKKSE